jgi:hypothetical protein
MPLPVADAVSRRDETLARTRQATRWMTTAAIAAAVVLSSAFAHALPGHHATARMGTSPPPQAGSPAHEGHSQGTSRHHAGAGRRHRRHHHHLQPPAQPPSPPPPSPPPPVVSGGS